MSLLLLFRGVPAVYPAETLEWPIALHQNHDPASYSETAERHIVSFKPERGPSLERRGTSIAATNCSFETVYRAADLDTFEEFYKYTLKDGVLAFIRKHPRTRAPVYAFFTDAPSVVGITRQLFRVRMAMRVELVPVVP